jgi:hypothetical protein
MEVSSEEEEKEEETSLSSHELSSYPIYIYKNVTPFMGRLFKIANLGK